MSESRQGAGAAGGHRGTGDAREPLTVSLDVSAVPGHPAGAGRYTVTLAEALGSREDVAVILVTRANDAGRWAALVPGATVEAVAPEPRPMRLLWEQTRLPRLLTRLSVDVHHGPHYTMPEGSSLPRVVTIHDLTVFDHPEWHDRSKVVFFRRAVRVAATQADVLVCVSRTTARRLTSLCSPQGEVRVVPHGVDLERFHPARDTPGPDRRGRPDTPVPPSLAALGVAWPYVAFMGTVEPRKDVPTLVRAFDRMCPAHPGLRLVLAGAQGWGEKAVARAVAEARHPERIVRLGYVPEEAVPDLLRGAAAVAYPALEEGFGLPVLEALACGSPLVTTAGTVMEELADGAALLVEPGDAEGLAGALDMLVRGDESLETRLARGLAVASRYSWRASAEGHVEAYRAAL